MVKIDLFTASLNCSVSMLYVCLIYVPIAGASC